MKTATCLVAAVGIVFAFQGVPRAEDYKVAASENFSGKPAAPVFQTAGQKKFRTMISGSGGERAEFRRPLPDRGVGMRRRVRAVRGGGFAVGRDLRRAVRGSAGGVRFAER